MTETLKHWIFFREVFSIRVFFFILITIFPLANLAFFRYNVLPTITNLTGLIICNCLIRRRLTSEIIINDCLLNLWIQNISLLFQVWTWTVPQKTFEDDDEHDWILKICRKGWDENVGYRPDLIKWQASWSLKRPTENGEFKKWRQQRQRHKWMIRLVAWGKNNRAARAPRFLVQFLT